MVVLLVVALIYLEDFIRSGFYMHCIYVVGVELPTGKERIYWSLKSNLQFINIRM